MLGSFYQANSVAGNMCSGRKNEKFVNISVYNMIIEAARWTVFIKLLFQSCKYQ